jgi:hypothetical protein
VTQHDEPAKSDEAARLYTERRERSRRLLAKIDELDAAIAAARNQKALRARLKRESDETRRELAAHLDERGYFEVFSSRNVVPIWLVAGIPSKKHREEARTWMARRGLYWNGSAPSLRHEVRKGLDERNNPVPEHRFGLHVERTIDIQTPRAFTINLLGEPYHVVSPAEKMTNEN